MANSNRIERFQILLNAKVAADASFEALRKFVKEQDGKKIKYEVEADNLKEFEKTLAKIGDKNIEIPIKYVVQKKNYENLKKQQEELESQVGNPEKQYKSLVEQAEAMDKAGASSKSLLKILKQLADLDEYQFKTGTSFNDDLVDRESRLMEKYDLGNYNPKDTITPMQKQLENVKKQAKDAQDQITKTIREGVKNGVEGFSDLQKGKNADIGVGLFYGMGKEADEAGEKAEKAGKKAEQAGKKAEEASEKAKKASDKANDSQKESSNTNEQAESAEKTAKESQEASEAQQKLYESNEKLAQSAEELTTALKGEAETLKTIADAKDSFLSLANSVNIISEAFNKLKAGEGSVGDFSTFQKSLSDMLESVNKISTALAGEDGSGLEKFGSTILDSMDNISKAKEQFDKLLETETEVAEKSKSLDFKFDPEGIEKMSSVIGDLKNSLVEISEILQKSTGILSTDKLDAKFDEFNAKAKSLKEAHTLYKDKEGKAKAKEMINLWKAYKSAGGQKELKDVYGPNAKGLKHYMSEHMNDEQMNTSATTALSGEAQVLKEIADQAERASQAEKQFADENERIPGATKASVGSINQQGQAFDKLFSKLSGDDASSATQQVQQNIKGIIDALNTPVSNNSAVTALQEIINKKDAIKSLADSVQSLNKQTGKINTKKIKTQESEEKKARETLSSDDFVTKYIKSQNTSYNLLKKYRDRGIDISKDQYGESLSNLMAKLRSQMESERTTVLNSGDDSSILTLYKQILDTLKQIEQVRARINSSDSDLNQRLNLVKQIDEQIEQASKFTSGKFIKGVQSEGQNWVNKFKQIRKQVASGGDLGKLSNDLKKVQGQFDKFFNAHYDDPFAKIVNNHSIPKLTKQIDDFIANNPNLSKQIKDRVQELREQLDSVMSKGDYDNVFNDFLGAQSKALRRGETGGTNLAQMLQNRITSNAADFFSQFFSFYDIINYAKQAAQNVVDIDSALTELAKVSDATNSRIQQSFQTSAQTAQELGASITDIVSDTADWSRLGYGIDQAESLAKTTQLYQNVGDNIDRQTAQQSIVSTLKGFQLDSSQAEDIVDKFNAVELPAHSYENAYIVGIAS